MFTAVLSLLHNVTTLLFGIALSAAFLGVRGTRRNLVLLSVFTMGVGAVSALCYHFFGESAAEKLYPLLVHLPLLLFFIFVYKLRFSRCLFALTSSYLCCQFSNWAGLVARSLSNSADLYYGVRIAVTVIAFFLLILVSGSVAQLLQKPTHIVLAISFVPVFYYTFDYATSVYTELLYSALDVMMEFSGIILCVAHILFLLLYFKQYDEKREAMQQQQLIEMQRIHLENELNANRQTQQTTALVRHDMRHFLANIASLIEQNDTQRALAYIGELTSAIEKSTPRTYSNNDTVNTILSAFESKIVANAITFTHTLAIPDTLPLSDINLTAILANALENAINATVPLPAEKRRIELDMRMHDTKLLLSLKNTFAQAPVLVDGIPRTASPQHGLGTQSIQYVTDKLGGQCQFTMQGELFVLRVVL